MLQCESDETRRGDDFCDVEGIQLCELLVRCEIKMPIHFDGHGYLTVALLLATDCQPAIAGCTAGARPRARARMQLSRGWQICQAPTGCLSLAPSKCARRATWTTPGYPVRASRWVCDNLNVQCVTMAWRFISRTPRSQTSGTAGRGRPVRALEWTRNLLPEK